MIIYRSSELHHSIVTWGRYFLMSSALLTGLTEPWMLYAYTPDAEE